VGTQSRRGLSRAGGGAPVLLTEDPASAILGKHGLSALDVGAENTGAEVLLEADYVRTFFEFLLQSQATRDPNLQLGIGIEAACSFHAELGYAAVQNAVVGHLRTGQPLFVDQDEPVIGKHEKVAENFESAADSLAWHEDWR
jgi:hypothetical protein